MKLFEDKVALVTGSSKGLAQPLPDVWQRRVPWCSLTIPVGVRMPIGW